MPTVPSLETAGPAKTIVEQRAHTPHWGMLSERDRAILLFENAWTRDAGTKHEKIRDAFGMSAARYYLIVNRILDAPEALEALPAEVGRLRRMREARLNKRANRVFE